MSARASGPGAPRLRAFTLIEVVLALGLFALLALALVRLVDTSLKIWTRADASRDLMEIGTAISELAAADLQAIEGGAPGDLLAEWTRHDAGGDGVAGLHVQRLRLVRQATAADLARLRPPFSQTGQVFDPRELGRIEVAWALFPSSGNRDPDARSAGILLRGERRVAADRTLSFFDEDFFDPSGSPPPGTLHEVADGVLWFSFLFAAPTSVVRDGWKAGGGLADCASAWDAWSRGRPDLEVSSWNETHAGLPEPGELPLLPRRVRLELEIERPADRRRRARLVELLDATQTSFRVSDGRHLPDVGAMILVDEEWLELVSKAGNRAGVLRGRRGSRPGPHDAGTLLHHGWRVVREIPLPVFREEWDL